MNPSASSTSRWKVHDLMSLIDNERTKKHALPFVAITETWLKSYIADAQLHIPGYALSRCDRDKRVGGGVLLYSHQDIPITSCKTYDDGTCEALFVTFQASKLTIANVYRPPNATQASFARVLQFLEKCRADIKDDSYQFWLVGDFNFPQIDWLSLNIPAASSSESSASASLLLSFMSRNLLNQYILEPTRNENILDLFITNNDYLVTSVTSLKTDLSDHNMVDVLLSFNPTDSSHSPVKTFNQNEFRSLDFTQTNSEMLKNKMSEVDWDSLRSSCSFEEFPAIFTDTVFRICQQCTPYKKISHNGKPKSLNRLRRKKSKLKVRLSAAELAGNVSRVEAINQEIALLCCKIREEIHLNLDQKEQRAISKIKLNPKYFYSYAKSFSRIKSSISMLFDESNNVETDKFKMTNILQKQFSSVYSDPTAPNIRPPDFSPPIITHPFSDNELSFSDKDIIDAIKDIKLDSASGPDGIPAVLLKSCAEQFCKPLRLIWEESMSQGVVPSFYKNAHVTPLYKKGDRAAAVNYRPVSLTSHVIKLYERIVRKVMVKYIEENNILSDKQHGFRSGRSCLTQMLGHFDEIMLGLRNGVDTDSIYLDYAKAFDKVDHNLLLLKLQKYGFSERIVNWIRSFLTDRKQCVVLDGHQSLLADILSGVPQGTVLGPILFILFINDLQNHVLHSSVSFFADDTRISKQINSERDVQLLQNDLDNVVRWSQSNNMKLHEDKFELLVHKHKRHDTFHELPFMKEYTSYTTSSGNVYPVKQLRDLGITVTSDLSWSSHIAEAVAKARATASWVLSVFKTRDSAVMITLYKSLVRSLLEYCCPLWNPSKINDIQLLESVQRSFTNRISGLDSSNYWERLKSLKLMSLQRRRERYMILQMWKILHKVTPNDLKIQFSSTSRLGIRAKIPLLNKSSSLHNQSLYDGSFAVLGPRLWNIIPVSLTKISDFLPFKANLSEFLRKIPDRPPVAGYTCQNSNSLLDWHTDKSGWSENAMAH